MAKHLHISAKKESKRIKPQLTGDERSLFDELNYRLIVSSSLKIKEKVAFFRLMATMINSGISIIKSLDILREQIEYPKLKIILEEATKKIKEGGTLSSALSDYPNDFTEAEVGMMRSGEATGKLNDTFLNLAQQSEKSAAIGKKLKGAMIYPSFILFVVAIALTGIIYFIIPQIKEVFEDMGATLPWQTQLLIDTSDFLLASGGPLGLKNVANIFLGVCFSFFFFMSFIKSKPGRKIWDRVLLKIPIFGGLVQKVAIVKMTRGLALLLGSGISIVKALVICSDMVGNEKYKERILRIAEDVKIGITIAENIKGDTEHFPPMVINMLKVGEQTAQINKISLKIAEFYEEEVDDSIKTLASLLEPLIIIFVGISIGGIVIAVMLPILNLSDLAGL